MKKMWIGILLFLLVVGSMPMTLRAEVGEELPLRIFSSSEGERREEAPFAGDEVSTAGTASTPEEFRAELKKQIQNFKEFFSILYTGSDADEVEKTLVENSGIESNGYYLFGTEYWQWMMTSGFAIDRFPEGKNKRFEFETKYRDIAKSERKLDDLVTLFTKAFIREGMSDYEKATLIHDYLVATKSSLESVGSPYEMMVTGKGGTEVYALLAYRLLEKAGIRSVLVTNNSHTHLWLKVQLDGEWYNLDAGWNEVDRDNPDSRAYLKNYRLVSDQKLNKVHGSQSPYIFYPSATSTRYDGENDGTEATPEEELLKRFLEKEAEIRADYKFSEEATAVAAPKSTFNRRSFFTVSFNHEVNKSAFDRIKLYRLENGRLQSYPYVGRENGKSVKLWTPRQSYYSSGIYYILVEKGIQSTSGNVLKKSYYQKIILSDGRN